MKELIIEARASALDRVIAFVHENIKGFCEKEVGQIDLAAEEIFINIAEYSYGNEKGMVSVRVESGEEAVITFTDSGLKFDPLQQEKPDLTLSAEERAVGGLGIFLAKTLMDELTYEYKDGKNILVMKKRRSSYESE